MSNFLPGFGTSWTKAKPHTQFTPFSDKNERWRPFLQQSVWQSLIRKKNGTLMSLSSTGQ